MYTPQNVDNEVIKTNVADPDPLLKKSDPDDPKISGPGDPKIPDPNPS